MAQRVLGKVALRDSQRNVFADQIDLVGDELFGHGRMDKVSSQKLWRNFVCVGRRLVFVRQVGQEAEAGHEGVEAGAVPAATLARAVLAFWKI